ncbi:MAG TPA: hypothetical protein VEQ60_00120 [Longimicrobium sp.]|nr:hypothetical protein [Longimicrobium sp.]
MNFPHRITARLLSCAATLACALSLALPARAVAQENAEEPRAFCKVGRPQPSCDRMLFAQFTYYPRIPADSDLESPYEWEIGALVNRGSAQAVGATLVLGNDGNGVRTAVKARYRRWLGRYAAFDAAGGLALARRTWAPTPAADRTAVGVTSDVALGLTDWVSVGVRGDLLWSDLDGAPAGNTYGTVRVGTRPGVVVSILGLALVAAFAGDAG